MPDDAAYSKHFDDLLNKAKETREISSKDPHYRELLDRIKNDSSYASDLRMLKDLGTKIK